MTETENLQRQIDELRAQLDALCASIQPPQIKTDRIFPKEVAALFGVSVWTVRRMENDFDFLRSIAKRTETNRVFWLRKEFEYELKMLERKNETRKPKGLIRKRPAQCAPNKL